MIQKLIVICFMLFLSSSTLAVEQDKLRGNGPPPLIEPNVPEQLPAPCGSDANCVRGWHCEQFQCLPGGNGLPPTPFTGSQD